MCVRYRELRVAFEFVELGQLPVLEAGPDANDHVHQCAVVEPFHVDLLCGRREATCVSDTVSETRVSSPEGPGCSPPGHR